MSVSTGIVDRLTTRCRSEPKSAARPIEGPASLQLNRKPSIRRVDSCIPDRCPQVRQCPVEPARSGGSNHAATNGLIQHDLRIIEAPLHWGVVPKEPTDDRIEERPARSLESQLEHP